MEIGGVTYTLQPDSILIFDKDGKLAQILAKGVSDKMPRGDGYVQLGKDVKFSIEGTPGNIKIESLEKPSLPPPGPTHVEGYALSWEWLKNMIAAAVYNIGAAGA